MFKRVKTSLIVLSTLFLLIGCQSPTPTPLPIAPPVIDGLLSPGEWDAAREESFTGGSQLFLLTSENYLYLGIRANFAGMLIGNVLLEQEDKISVLHISAALGTAIYQQGDEGWQLIQDFTYRCRDTGSSPAAIAEREAFLKQDGWLGSISYMGTPEELEYQILLPEGPLRMLVIFESLELQGVLFLWPANAQGDTTTLTHGDSPTRFTFTPEAWAEINLTPNGELEVSIPSQ